MLLGSGLGIGHQRCTQPGLQGSSSGQRVLQRVAHIQHGCTEREALSGKLQLLREHMVHSRSVAIKVFISMFHGGEGKMELKDNIRRFCKSCAEQTCTKH